MTDNLELMDEERNLKRFLNFKEPNKKYAMGLQRAVTQVRYKNTCN